ncbi:MAG: glycosyltransferase [Thermoflexales bacterium]|nr:glycosyltransferase [Thermoflexales bacterium]MDW8350765.1 glycosyltransferase [Anaerolineae bacterium]
MRLLFVTPQLPYPPQQGTALRNWGLISHLAARHEVWLVSFDEGAAEERRELPEPLRRVCRRVSVVPAPMRTLGQRLRTLATSTLPDMAWRLWSPEFAQVLTAHLRDRHFDIAQFEGIELARYMIGAARQPHTARFVLDEHNAEYLLQKRAFEADARAPRRWHAAAYSFVQWQRLRAFERRALTVADATLCVSPEDAAALRRLAPSVQPAVIHNGIDVAHYAQFASPAPDSARPPSIVFTGKMDFRPNVDAVLWFVRRAWPAVKQAHPDARLYIVGQKPSPRLDALRADPDIVLTGQVDDVRPYIAQADVYVAPLLAGGGTRFKLLEAMAMRRAIVSTSLGCEGFPVTSGRELIVADRPADFAGAVAELLRSPARRAALGESAYRFVAATYDWSVITPKLEQVYERLIGR